MHLKRKERRNKRNIQGLTIDLKWIIRSWNVWCCDFQSFCSKLTKSLKKSFASIGRRGRKDNVLAFLQSMERLIDKMSIHFYVLTEYLNKNYNNYNDCLINWWEVFSHGAHNDCIGLVPVHNIFIFFRVIGIKES